MTGIRPGPGPRFGHLVAKPELACTAACPTCATRKALHRGLRRQDFLAFADWQALFGEARELGASRLTISGGEPMLYDRLADMIAEGKRCGWRVDVNTNGSRTPGNVAPRLLAAGLDAVVVSLYAGDASIHDRMRNRDGLWRQAVETVEAFVAERQRAPGVGVGMQTIVCRDNFRSFPDLLRLAYRLGVGTLTFSYLEGDYAERRFLLDEAEVSEFKRRIVPEALAVIRATAADPWARRVAAAAVRSLYAGGAKREKDYAQGIYRRPRPCPVPSFFSIVLANGDVHPCNMVEYAHQPVIGNLRQSRFTDLWSGPAWRDFRRRGFSLCRYCPVPAQTVIPISGRPILAPLQVAFCGRPLRWAWPFARRLMIRRRRFLKRTKPPVRPSAHGRQGD